MTDKPLLLDIRNLGHGSFLLHSGLLLSSWCGVLVGSVLMAMTGIGIIGAALWVTTGVWLVPLFGFVFGYVGLHASRQKVIDSTDTKLVGEDDRVNVLVREVAARLAMPVPLVGIYPDADMNAFAAGSGRDNAVVSFSKGILAMPDDELRAVAAHEMAHIANRDMRRMQLANSFQNSLTFYLAWTHAGQAFGRWVLGLLGEMMVLWLSRHREYWADATSGALLGKEHMIAALRRLDSDRESPPAERLAYARMMIRHNPRSLMSTHPSISERIEALEQETYMSRLPYTQDLPPLPGVAVAVPAAAAPAAAAPTVSSPVIAAERFDPAPAVVSSPELAPEAPVARETPPKAGVGAPPAHTPRAPVAAPATGAAENYALAFCIGMAAFIAGLLGYAEHTRQVDDLKAAIGKLQVLRSNDADAITRERGAWSSERYRFANERSAWQSEREKIVRERDQAVRWRDQIAGERDSAIAERNRLYSERSALQSERDRAIERLNTQRYAEPSPPPRPYVAPRAEEAPVLPPRPYAVPRSEVVPAPPPPPPAPLWGALAQDGNNSFYTGPSQASENDAVRESLAYCQARGMGCRVVKTFYRACAVVASSLNGGWGWATAPTQDEATQNAMASCVSRNGICFPTFSWCSYR